jgi:hypothetical protein
MVFFRTGDASRHRIRATGRTIQRLKTVCGADFAFGIVMNLQTCKILLLRIIRTLPVPLISLIPQADLLPYEAVTT